MIPDQYRYEYLTALTHSCDELYRGLDASSRQQAWKAVRDALGWLHRIEELAKRHPDYFTLRGRSAEGRTMAGLIWVRTVLDHRGAAVLAPTPVPAIVTRLGSRGGRTVHGGGMQELAASIVWPARSALPPGQRERHGRDVLYDTHVAGRDLLTPLRDALTFLTDLGADVVPPALDVQSLAGAVDYRRRP